MRYCRANGTEGMSVKLLYFAWVLDRIGKDHFFLSVDEAVVAMQARTS